MSKMLRMSEEEYAKRQKVEPRIVAKFDNGFAPKYRNKTTVVDGVSFASKKEAKRWQELRLLEASGQIKDLQTQVKYPLTPSLTRSDGKKERASHYVADFSYLRSDRVVVEDVKGMKTPMYILKRKLMLHIHGITIIEV